MAAGPASTPVPTPALTDGTITLRAVDGRDVDQIHAACVDERLQRYIPVPRPYERAHAEAYVARTVDGWTTGRKSAFAITPAGDDERLLGVISITLAGNCGNTAYWIAPGERGRGVARRALELVADWAFRERALAIILLEIHASNEASMAVAHACGFHESGKIEVGQGRARREALLFVRMVTDPEPT